MKNLFASIFLILFLSAAAHSQYAYRVIPRAADPGTCSPANGDVYFNTATNSLRQCIAANTWNNVGFSGSGISFAQGTLTVNTPVISSTATWNNVAVTFTHILSNVTDTASAVGSMLLDLQVGGVSAFNVTKQGSTTITSTGGYRFSTRSQLRSPADGILSFLDNAGGDFELLILGTATIAHPAIKVVDAVGGQTQGIKIVKGGGNDAVFANLGAAENGAMIYCSDCTIASPCAGAGTGSIAKRLNGVWVCN